MRNFTHMNRFKNSSFVLFYASILTFCIAVLGVSSFTGAFFISSVFAQTTVAITVNGNPITNYDIQRRIAFLKLQQKQGDLSAQARNELIDEMLKNIEIQRLNIDVSDNEINSAFANFAEQNNMTVDQLSEMLNQTEVTEEHFKAYISGQMGWGRLVNARYQSEDGYLSEQEAAHRILKNGGIKPSTNEYTLQQIIFVIPAHRRAELLTKRTQEINNFRAHFRGCDNTKKQTRGILDVTVRNLGKFLEPQLPTDWEQAIRATPAGKMTQPHETPYGIEALAVCQIKKVSDDRVAQLMFSIQDSQKRTPQKLEALSEKYLKELRQRAHIQNHHGSTSR
ncbi:peptidylprolyl isomerase [Bartonella schoenbuchensis]|uniref:Periplasmic chaperone for outer membrane proteins SurA n=2 Tax=Bartonella schoenbuchensis TaxID=165694 RepID=A0A1S6XP71_BARSR|nr:peptidylprolyl isomerase [Bartonella schoenbuchensis]AQX30440.1 periplasmic chaperone for outer membrane proteins SurA [Bartonella schoenbuchensis R1]CDP79918.1 peptidyl-prolyl cis-trans isomerase [Bartonella schoenbuchensis]